MKFLNIIGLMNNQVLQRNSRNLCEATLSGQCAANGVLRIKVTKKGRTVPGFSARTIGQVKRRRFNCKLKGIPVGGPYQITLTPVCSAGGPTEQLEFENILVGDVWILGGQSNMEGIGQLKDAANPHRRLRELKGLLPAGGAFWHKDLLSEPAIPLALAQQDKLWTSSPGGL